MRGPVPALPFAEILRAVLPNYSLSLVLCGDALARRMNREYRNKTYTPNVLSFPLSKTEGEIFLNVREAAREARRLKINLREHLAFLFIHGVLHLGGHRHGRTMENAEQALMRRFAARVRRVPNANHLHRH